MKLIENVLVGTNLLSFEIVILYKICFKLSNRLSHSLLKFLSSTQTHTRAINFHG